MNIQVRAALKPLFDQHSQFRIKEINVEYWRIASVTKNKSLCSEVVVGSSLVV